MSTSEAKRGKARRGEARRSEEERGCTAPRIHRRASLEPRILRASWMSLQRRGRKLSTVDMSAESRLDHTCAVA
mgnify:CR=1 FL=1